jgi:hypothetical protein
VSTKKRWTWIGALALFALCVYLLPFVVHPPGYLKDVDRIRAGMTISEVESILGKSTFKIPNPTLSPPGYALHYELADGWTSISFDGDDKVKSIIGTYDNVNRFWQSIKWLLH